MLTPTSILPSQGGGEQAVFALFVAVVRVMKITQKTWKNARNNFDSVADREAILARVGTGQVDPAGGVTHDRLVAAIAPPF